MNAWKFRLLPGEIPETRWFNNLQEAILLNLEREEPREFDLVANLLYRLHLSDSQNMPNLKQLSGKDIIKILDRFVLCPNQLIQFWLFWFLCGNEVYTDRISAK